MEEMTLLWLFDKGGWSMWPLLIMSIITVAVSIERGIYFLLHDFKISDIEEKTLNFVKDGDFEGATKYLGSFKKNKIGTRILIDGIKMAKLGEHRMEKTLESETQEKIQDIEKGLNLLVEMSSLGPITGFLGTVSGMIGAFSAISKATDVNAQLVAGGIFEALITTAFGLIIAVVAIAMYNVFTSITERFVSNVERVGTDIITSIVVAEFEAKENNK